jgi:outer membrane protein TolC
MAGFLPTVSLTAGRTFQWVDIDQKFSSGLEVKRSGVASNQSNAGLAISIPLFDGGRMFVVKKRQDQQQGLANLRLQNQILGFTDSLTAAYFQLVASRYELKNARKEAERTQERLSLASGQVRIGTRPKTDELLARIDLNTANNRIRSLEWQEEIRKGAFNQLLARDPDLAFSVPDSIPEVLPLDWTTWKNKALEGNLGLKIQNQSLAISQSSVEEIKSRAYPQINLNSAMSFARTNSKAGFALFNQSLGPAVGLGLSVPLFSGVSVRKLSSLAEMGINNQKIQIQAARTRLLAQVWHTVKTMEFQLETTRSENENRKLAEENLFIARERYRLGQATILELKEAELQLSAAENRWIQARLAAKLAESQAIRLAGEVR